MALSPWRVVPRFNLNEVAHILMGVGHPVALEDSGINEYELDTKGIDAYEKWREVLIGAAQRGEIEPIEIETQIYNSEEKQLVWQPGSLSDRDAWEGIDAWNIDLIFTREEVYRWLKASGIPDDDIPQAINVTPAGKQTVDNGELHPKREATYQRIIAALVALQYGGREIEHPYQLADELRDDCQRGNIKAPASRTKLGELFEQLPPVQKADLD